MAAAAAAMFLPGYHFSSSLSVTSRFDDWPDVVEEHVAELEPLAELAPFFFELALTPSSLPGYHLSDS
jgi:hypothetical protein